MSTNRMKAEFANQNKSLLDDDYLERKQRNHIEMEARQEQLSRPQRDKAEIKQYAETGEKLKDQTSSFKTRSNREAGIDQEVAFWTNPNGPFVFSVGFGRLPGPLAAPAINVEKMLEESRDRRMTNK